MKFFRQEYWSGLPFPPPGDLPNPGIEPMSLTPSALAGRFFTTKRPENPLDTHTRIKKKKKKKKPDSNVTTVPFQFSSVQSLSHVQLFATP